MDFINKIFSLVERKREEYDDMLKKERRPSLGSGEGSKRVLEWISDKIRKSGALIEPLEAGPKSPPVLYATLGKQRDKKTILVYVHLNPSCRDKELSLFGNGMKDARGPMLSLFTALDAYREFKTDVPVNIKFLVEAMTDKDSEAFTAFLYKFSGTIFTGIDYITVLDNRPNYFYGIRPLLCCGLRGCCKFEVQIDCAKKTLNSGDDGGAIQEAMTDMVALFSTLVNSKGDILVPGLNNDIQSVTPHEEQDYHKSTFDVDRYKKETGANKLLHKEEKKRVLMHMTRFPSLSILDIRTKEDSKNGGDVHGSVIGTFCVRIVPNQSVASVNDAVKQHFNKTMASINSSNTMALTMTESARPWEANPNDPNLQACMRALKRAYKEEAELVREGGTIPVLNELQENSGKQILLLPIGRSKCHSPSMTESNVFMDATKIICAYFFEVSQT